MMNAAERLMGERGIGAVSIRDVLDASQQRNNSAAAYHFGSWDGLISALIESRMAPINDARQRMLDELDAAGRPPQIRQLVNVLVDPLADATVRRSDSHYCRFLAQSHTDPTWTQLVEVSQHGTAYRRWRQQLHDQLVDVPAELRFGRIDRVVTMVIVALSRWERKTNRGRVPLEARLQDLVDSAVAVLEAPASPTTSALLAPTQAARTTRKRRNDN